ncbi:MAG: HEAT repeat domain-containing protein [Planctomycetes bacterium]|nr:HEAT repeat domain-containing protein [Planctomycetota bacterium]
MDEPVPAPRVPSTVADFLSRAQAPSMKKSARRMWKGSAARKPLGPQGKVPAGIRGISRRTAGELQAERAAKWEREQARDMRSWVSRSPAWALSLALHLVAAVVMMNVVYFTQGARIGQVFRMSLRAAAPGGADQGEQDAGVNGKDNEDNAPAGDLDPDAPPLPMPPSSDTASLPALNDGRAPALPMGVVGETSGENGFGGIYAGRGGSGRGDALRRYGGDGESEQAVVDGLEWLARHQSAEGCWEISGFAKRCPADGRCDAGLNEQWGYAFQRYTAAVTGLAVLAFLGAGYSHMDDHLRPQDQVGPVKHRYTGTIDRALVYLTRVQRADGLVISGQSEYERAMYSHGMAGLALIEAYSITHDPRLRPHAQLAVNRIVEAQQRAGGWDYSPVLTGRSDTSVTSWQVLCLRSARAAGLAVPKKAWERAKAYLTAVTDLDKGTIGYEIEPPNSTVSPGCNAMVAAGWVTRVYLGMADDHPTVEKFMAAIRRVPPRYDSTWGACLHWSNLASSKAEGHWSLYYTYNATLAMFHHGGEAWEDWNTKMRACTLRTQKREGHLLGSWDPVTSDASMGGRVYATAMNVMNLEIYYRYLPCYEVGSEFGLSPLVEAPEWKTVVDNTVKGTFHERRGAMAADPDDPSGARPEATVASLLEGLKSGDMMTRRNAARELSARREKSAVPALIEAARAETTSLKPILVEYLGGFETTEPALDFLIELLGSDVSRLKAAAHAALKKSTGLSLGPYLSDWQAWRRGRDGGGKK